MPSILDSAREPKVHESHVLFDLRLGIFQAAFHNPVVDLCCLRGAHIEAA